MDSLSVVEARLPPGFRFHPRDDELVLDYLSRKLDGDGGGAVSVYGCPMMVEVDLNKCEPWDLPEIACVGGKEWYFYSLKDKKYATGQRTNRATESGHWKATGKDRLIRQKGLLVGMRKTLVFYQGRAPMGRKTEWVMHEFRKEEQEAPVRFPFKEDWVLCRVFNKSRATTAKPTGESACYKGTTSTSLPTRADNCISFDQPGSPWNLEGYEQVPCFSSPSQPPSSMNLPSIPIVEGQNMGIKAIKNVVSQFTRFEGIVKRELPQRFGLDRFESWYLENGLTQMWSSFS